MKFNQLLVPIDFSDVAQAALHAADELARDHQGSLTLFHVHPIMEVAVMDFTYVEAPEKVMEMCDAAEAQLRQWAAKLSTPAERVNIRVITGNPVAEIVAFSDAYDVVVMGTHGRGGLQHALMGSVAERVAHGARCAVLVVKIPAPAQPA